MKISTLVKDAFAISAGAAILAACSSNGRAALAPSGSTDIGSMGASGFGHVGRTVTYHGLLLTAAHPSARARGPQTISPDKKKHKKKAADQYIADLSGGLVEFDYPKSDMWIGTISGTGQGECTNVLYGTGKKTFWVTNSSSEAVEEFDVGGRNPIKTLTTSAGEPVGCAIDPATGDLVATIIENGQVVLWKNASGTGTVTQTPLTEAFFAAYDNNGNLFVDGFNSNDAFGFVELPKGTSTWETLSTSNSVEFPGNVQFDGTYVTVNDQEAHDIFGYTCSGTNCTLEQTVALVGSSDCNQTWIAKGYVICPDAGNEEAEIFKYPAGGSAIAVLIGPASFSEPLASVQAAK